MISKKDEKILRKLLSMATEPEEALTYNEMCGFLYGVAMTPDMIVPSEWLPCIFGEEMISVDSQKEGQKLFSSLLLVVNNLTEHFYDETLEFPFDEDYLEHENDLHVVFEWVYGLAEALSLREYCWDDMIPKEIHEGSVEDYKEDILLSLSVIHGIAYPDEVDDMFETHFKDEEDPSGRLMASLFVMLPTAFYTILDHAYYLEEERREHMKDSPSFPQPIRREGPKIGRNDPCHCGSGKKYKKCCIRTDKVVPIR